MFENIRLAFHGIWSHKMRSILTMLGIIIGIAAIIAIVSTIQGTNEQIKNQLIGSGKNTVNVKLSQSDMDYEISDSSSIPYGIPTVSAHTMEEINRIKEVENVTAYCSRSTSTIKYDDVKMTYIMVDGIDDNYFDTCEYSLKSGRLFNEDDSYNYRCVAILDVTAARKLFREENPIGKIITIDSTPFTVVGVVKEKENTKLEINTIEDYQTYASSSNGCVFIPKDDWAILYNFDEPENIVVKATSTDDMTKAGKKTADILNATILEDTVKTIKYKAEDLLGQAQQLQELSNATNMQLVWIAGISLLVGGIGVMNIMLVSVTERTNEIGLKKALGAQKSAILGQFLTEAAVLTSLGGILGVLAGIVASNIIHKVTGVLVSINILAAGIAVGFSMMIGIIFGLLPSIKAAGLDPIEALRRE